MAVRIMQLVNSFEQGGSEGQAVQLVELLSKTMGFDVSIATLSRTGVLEDRIRTLGIEEVPEYRLTSFYDSNFIVQLKRFVKSLRRQRVQIIHTHDFYTNVFGMMAGWLAHVPIRIASKRESIEIRSRSQSLVELSCFRAAQMVVANSVSVKERLVGLGLRADRIKIISNGIDETKFIEKQNIGPAERLSMLRKFKLPASADTRVITLVANLRLEAKNHPMFLRSAKLIKDAVPSAVFVVAGEGRMLDEMRSLANDLGIGESTYFIGQCDAIEELLAITDVSVLTSSSEGFSNAILEYMAAACPTVATDVGGAREVIVHGENGFLVESDDHQEMSQRVTFLLNDPVQATEIGARGRETVVQSYGLSTRLEKTLQLYSQLLATECKITEG